VARDEQNRNDEPCPAGVDENPTEREEESMKDGDGMVERAAERAYELLHTGQRRA
jgi:hypothetical protein